MMNMMVNCHFFRNISRICCLIFIVVLIVSGCSSGSRRYQNELDPLHFIIYGRVFEIDLEEMKIISVTRFHPSAPTVARAPDGLYWARVGEKGMAGYNPINGKQEATVMLPYRPYNHIITPEGKAYVTHHTLTGEGFSVSVIDTDKNKLTNQLKNISGLRTDIAYGYGHVYLATEDVGNDSCLHLYQIDTRNDHLEEIYRVPESGFSWRVSVYADVLVLGRVYRSKSADSIQIILLDRSGKEVLQRIDSDDLGDIQILGKMIIVHESGFLPCRTKNNGFGIAVFNLEGFRIQDILPVTAHVYQIIGTRENLLIYTDHPLNRKRQGIISLYFYDMNQRKEVKVIDVLEHLVFE